MGSLEPVGGFRLQPPQQHIHLVARPALLGALDQALQRRLLLLLAPAGYGKTTLLSQWRASLHARGDTVAWLTLDEQSGSASALLAAIIHALSAAGVNLGELATAPLQMLDRFGPARTFDILMSALDRVEPGIVLIVDDYHFAQTAETDDLVGMFIRRTRDTVHLVIASRFRPGLVLPALRAQGQVRELGVAQLRFSHDEARELLGPAISNADATALNAQAEGWAIALQLAGLWMQDHGDAAALLQSFSGSSDDIAQYLTKQVFSGLPADLQEFMLETSIFDQFDAALADAARDESNSAHFIRALRGLNGLVIPIDPHSTQIRYHRLVADFLAQRRDQLGAPRLRALHRASSTWFAMRGDMLASARHAIAAGDRGTAVALIERADCVGLSMRGEAWRLASLFALLDPAEIRASARLLMASAVVLLKQGKLDAADRVLADARQRTAIELLETDRDGFARDELIFVALRAGYRDTDLSPADHDAIDRIGTATLGADVFLRAFLSNILCTIHLRMGQIASAERHADTALGLFGSIGYIYGCVFIHIHLGTVLLAQDRPQDALQSLDTAITLIRDHFGSDGALLALAQIPLAECHHQQGIATAATAGFEANLATVVAAEGWPQIFVIGFGTVADRAFAMGGLHAAEPVLQRGLDLARANGLWQVEAFLMARHAGLLVRADCLDAAQQRIADIAAAGRGQPALLWVAADELSLATARLGLAQGDAGQALELLTTLIADAECGGRWQSAIRAQALAAIALRQLDRTGDATTVLLCAFDGASAQGCRQLFIDEGRPMAALLRETIKRGGGTSTLRAFMTDLLAAFLTSGAPDETHTPLTPREREILHALVQGGSNKMIARSVGLNENAVKFHLKSVFRKLGVSDRAMAVVVAAKLEIPA